MSLEYLRRESTQRQPYIFDCILTSPTRSAKETKMKPSPPTVIAYTRVSTGEQATEGVSLGAQREQVIAYCKINGLRLQRIYCDAGLSGKNTTGRPAALEVLDLIRRREVDGLVVCKLDRLVRSTRDALDVASLCRKRDVALHSIAERLDTSTSMGTFFFTLMAALGELERETIADRTRTSLRHMRAQGLKTGGSVPFGFSVRQRRRSGKRVRYLVANRAEQAVVRLAIRLRRTGGTLRSIAAELTRRRIRTKQGRSVWHPEGVRSIIKVDESR